jgi:putative sigma-54 modulation protein
MNFIIRGDNLDVTTALREYVEKKLSRLEKYFEHLEASDAHVSLSVEGEEHKVEVTLFFPGHMVRAEESSEDMYASVDLVLEKLERQIRKYKTKVNRKARQNGSLRTQLMENSLDQSNLQTLTQEDLEDEEFKIVRVKRFSMKPMFPEEAILQMELLGHNFFVFNNADTNEMNVIYRRKNGTYGLIEPEM